MSDSPAGVGGGRLFGALYIAPAVLLTVAFFIVPLVFIVFITPMKWDGIGAMSYVGLANIRRLASDPAFAIAFRNTLVWIVVGLLVHIPLALLVALALYKRPVLWRVFRSSFFVPSIISTTALALLWYFVFNPEFGILNATLRAIGLEGLGDIAWLSNLNTALWASMLPYVIYVGFPMMIFLTQIASIPEDYFEAAKIDGASDWQIDLFITVPLIRPALVLNGLFVTTHCLRMFEYPFIMTDGGPANTTSNLSLYIYKTMIQSYDYGSAMAASGVTVLAGIVIVSAIYLLSRLVPGVR